MSWFARKENGKIVSVSRSLQPQPDGTEHTDGVERLDNDPEVQAFLHPSPDPRLIADSGDSDTCKADATIMTLINQTRAEWRTWAAANFPTLTAAERTKLGDLFWVTALGARQRLRGA